MGLKQSVLFLMSASTLALVNPAFASEPSQRLYDQEFFQPFAPQTALEMVARLPGFVLQEAGEERGLSQGGTNILINGQPIIGKGETVTNQIAQVATKSVVSIEIVDAASLDLPGYSGLVANIITKKTSTGGSWLWEPEWRPRNETAFANGNINISGSRGDVDFSAAFTSEMVRAGFFGPETLSNSNGIVFETRNETLRINGEQPTLSGSLQWKPTEEKLFNAKASVTLFNLNRPQISETKAVTARGQDTLNISRYGSDQTTMRFDTDYSFPAFAGTTKLIAFANQKDIDAITRLTVDDSTQQPLSNLQFFETSKQQEGVLRFEQNWDQGDGRSWQLGGEGAYNLFDLETQFSTFNPTSPDILLNRIISDTKIEESRAELTLAHQRRLNARTDLQLSVGAETSTIKQGQVQRKFNRPKGFLSVTTKPSEGWTLTARASRDIGQINFRNFAASTSLVEGVSTEDNPELVPQQSWSFSGRVERRFKAGHIAAIEFEHDIISDLVDRIPLGNTGDAVGNIPNATSNKLSSVATLLGAPFGIKGAQLDLRATWRWSLVVDPIQGFDRDIAALRKQDLKAEFRHDIPNTNWTYGFTVQKIDLAPRYQSTLVQFSSIPSGGLTPGENSIFLEHKDVLGLRVRATVFEFLEQENNFKRVISTGRRDISTIDRIENRVRDLDGPFLKLSIGSTF